MEASIGWFDHFPAHDWAPKPDDPMGVWNGAGSEHAGPMSDQSAGSPVTLTEAITALSDPLHCSARRSCVVVSSPADSADTLDSSNGPVISKADQANDDRGGGAHEDGVFGAGSSPSSHSQHDIGGAWRPWFIRD